MMYEDYPDVEVKLLSATPDPEHNIEWAGRLCWDTQGNTGNHPGRIQEWIKRGHESVLEHSSATFWIKASRVLTHELVRHRIASYSQRSQRYVREWEVKVITPPELAGLSKGLDKEDVARNVAFLLAIEKCWESYTRLLELGVNSEIARYVLPGACETQIVVTMNFRELRHFIKLRTSERDLPEMRVVARRIRDICKSIAPS